MVNKKKKVNLSNKPTPKKVKKVQTVKRPQPAQIQMPKKGNNSLISVIVSMAVTTLIVGGGVYAWQKKASFNKIELKEQETQNLKYDLEEMLAKTKRKLSGAESENIDLKSENEELKAKADLLDIAKREFVSQEYGFSFFYPVTFGEVSIELEEGTAGKKIIGTFSDNKNLVFGGITEDYINSTSTEPAFMDTQGFRKRWGKYFYKALGSETYEVNPVKIVGLGEGEAIFLDKNSFTVEEDETVPVNIGENVGFLINLENDEFSGIAFLNSDFGALPPEEFELLVKTININK